MTCQRIEGCCHGMNDFSGTSGLPFGFSGRYLLVPHLFWVKAYSNLNAAGSNRNDADVSTNECN